MSTTTTAETIELTVIGGDSKLDLFQQLLFVGMRDNDGRTVAKSFRVLCVPKGTPQALVRTSEEYFNLQVQGLVAEDGSGDNWIIRGNISETENKRTRVRGTFTGFYSTRRREGFLTITTS